MIKIDRFLYNPRYADMLNYLEMKGVCKVSELQKKSGMNYGHLVTGVLPDWHRKGYLCMKKNLKDYDIELTEHGKEIAKKVIELTTIVKRGPKVNNDGRTATGTATNTIQSGQKTTKKNL